MTDFKNSEISQLLPLNFTKSPEVQAISYALSLQIKKLISAYTKTSFVAMIDTADHDILDHLALAWRTQYYDDRFTLEKKRKLIKGTFRWYMKAGTKWAVEELATACFGASTVQEWFEYEGLPKHFRITAATHSTEESFNLFESAIRKVKNTRSILDGIDVIVEAFLLLYYQKGALTSIKTITKSDIKAAKKIFLLSLGALTSAKTETTATLKSAEAGFYIAAGCSCGTETIIRG